MATIINIAAGPRGVHTTEGFVLIEVGASITAQLDDAERASAEATGYFTIDDDAIDAKPASKKKD